MPLSPCAHNGNPESTSPGLPANGNPKERPRVSVVEVAGGLVGQRRLRLQQQGSADGYPLLLALGEPVRAAPELVPDSHPLCQPRGPLAHPGISTFVPRSTVSSRIRSRRSPSP